MCFKWVFFDSKASTGTYAHNNQFSQVSYTLPRELNLHKYRYKPVYHDSIHNKTLPNSQ